MSKWAAHQQSLNRQTSGSWAIYSSHRQRLTQLLAPGKPGMRLCVLGAGNCNDLDFEALLATYREITLVDLDDEAVTSAFERQSPAVQRALVLRAPIDFGVDTGSAAGTGASLPNAGHLASALAGRVAASGFDVVCSSCVLSQLIARVAESLASEPQRCLEQVQLARAVHLHLMLVLLRSGGRGLLVSDLVSSDTVPELQRTPPAELPKLMARLVADKNFFTGLNPFVLEGLLKKDPQLAPQLARSVFHAPWLWQLAQQRSYLTFAFSFMRA